MVLPNHNLQGGVCPATSAPTAASTATSTATSASAATSTWGGTMLPKDPVEYPEVWEMYKKHEASFWTAQG